MEADDTKPPYASAAKRRLIDLADLASSLADLERRDANAPPRTLLTTMGAVRLLGDLVLDRHDRGWTDPMLVALLRELGVEISPETLRVYRGRLKKERGEEATQSEAPGRSTRASVQPTKSAGDTNLSADPAQSDPKVSEAGGAEPQPSDGITEQPFNRSIAFDDRV
ncbi:hypothetical protein SPAN111604_14825 [Sphingomonas antarctica]|uniref:hypothetical protein n=1 Tax=Sphingomonas antarctica TaxID=2040274 RepID=UPI0039E9789C